MEPTHRVILSEGEQLARWIDHRLTHLETIMADLKTALDALTASVSDYTSDVSAKLADIAQQQQAMQQTLDAALANDATDQATIAELRAQLMTMQGATNEAVARVQALDEAVKLADQPVDRPTP